MIEKKYENADIRVAQLYETKFGERPYLVFYLNHCDYLFVVWETQSESQFDLPDVTGLHGMGLILRFLWKSTCPGLPVPEVMLHTLGQGLVRLAQGLAMLGQGLGAGPRVLGTSWELVCGGEEEDGTGSDGCEVAGWDSVAVKPS